MTARMRRTKTFMLGKGVAEAVSGYNRFLCGGRLSKALLSLAVGTGRFTSDRRLSNLLRVQDFRCL